MTVPCRDPTPDSGRAWEQLCALGFRVQGFGGLGFRRLGFRVQGFNGLGFRGLGV